MITKCSTPNSNKFITLPSHAKINLFLHVTGKRKNGYHNLQTWFQFIDLKDVLHFSVRDDNQIKLLSNTEIVKEDKDNLVYKAALTLKNLINHNFGINIYINKNIPMGSGLGGASSNTATTLLALNFLWKCNLSDDELINLGASLGADVPIFLLQDAAWAEGFGEILIRKPYIEQYALIIKPDFHTSTRQSFNYIDSHCYKPLLNHDQIDNPLPYSNVFFKIIQATYPEHLLNLCELTEIKNWRLTGTGSCFYILSENPNFLSKIQKKLGKNIDSWIVKTLNSVKVIGIKRKQII